MDATICEQKKLIEHPTFRLIIFAIKNYLPNIKEKTMKKIIKYGIIISLMVICFGAGGLFVNSDNILVNDYVAHDTIVEFITAVNVISDNIILKGKVILTQKEFDKIPNVKSEELPNTDMYPTVAQFKIKVENEYMLIDIVNVDDNENGENGINIFITEIEMDKT
jgi:hypothetical protein